MSDVLWTCLELLANIFQSFVGIHFITRSFGSRCRLVNIKLTYLIGIVTVTIMYTVMNMITVYEGLIGSIIYTVVFFIFSLVFLYGSVLKKVFIAILTNTVLISIAAFSANVLFVIFKDDPVKIYTEHSFESFLFMVIGNALWVYAFEFLVRFTGAKNDVLKIKEWVLILSVLTVSTLIIAVIRMVILDDTNDNRNNLLMLSEFGIIIINILCLYITSSLNETHKREGELELEKNRIEYDQRYAQTVKDQYEQTRRLRHDMKQYVASLSTLIKEEKYSAALELIEKQGDDLAKVETIIDVGNDLVNAILNTKLTLAKSKSIDVICSIEKNISGVDDMDLCNLLGNTLDNAIAAAELCDTEARSVEVKISSEGSRLVILVKNSIPRSVLGHNPHLRSTKPDPQEHGFGVKTIKAIAEKYSGKTDYYEEGLTFICRSELHRK